MPFTQDTKKQYLSIVNQDRTANSICHLVRELAEFCATCAELHDVALQSMPLELPLRRGQSPPERRPDSMPRANENGADGGIPARQARQLQAVLANAYANRGGSSPNPSRSRPSTPPVAERLVRDLRAASLCYHDRRRFAVPDHAQQVDEE